MQKALWHVQAATVTVTVTNTITGGTNIQQQIPGFSWLSIVVGGISGLFALMLLRKKISEGKLPHCPPNG